ncbi:MAG TPA: protein kinase [Vicinamibacterales bacterium]|jgi:TolB-like protein/tRNA A-37 threonylcarbamoyl transferase component Bud32/Flp pilus assembly protein TadD
MSEPDDLLALADSVAHGSAVDWAAESEKSTDVGRDLLEQLRIIEAVARMHRSQSDADDRTPDAVHSDPLPAGARWQHLVIVDRVGGGTFGDVYRARDTKLDREVALKLLRRRAHPEALASQILSEGRLLARVAHPNVITIHGAEAVNGQVGLWMEFIRGFTLEEVLRQHGPFSAREATFIGLDLCRALAAVHATGLVHRDVKAPNVMREQGGRIVLMDFGTGEDLSAAAEGMAGTPLYLAPEIFKGEPATIKSDLYSLGVLLYRLTTGTYPVTGASLRDLAEAHRMGRGIRLRDARPNLPDGFVRVVERALESDPEQRFPSAGAMESALVGWLGIGGRSDEQDALASTPAEPHAPPNRTPADASRWKWLAGAVVAVAIGFAVLLGVRARSTPAQGAPAASASVIRSIAVLPLQNLGGGDYFADGMTEALIADLGRTGILDVISRTSVMRFRGSQQPLPEIAKALNVDAIIEGSVLRDKGRVRITAQLIDARTDRHLWANSYERDVRDVLALQGEVARAIAQEINVTLTRQQEARLVGGRRPVSEEALEAYLQGRFNWNRRGGDSLSKAVDYFDQAIKVDPNYAVAYAGLADSYTLLGTVGGVMRPADAAAKAKEAAQAALRLDDSLGEAHTSLAMQHFWYDWDWAAAESEFKKAISLNRSYPTAHHWYAIYLSAMGRHDEAVVEIDQALRLDPVAPIIRASRGWIDFHRRRYDASIEEARKALDLDPNFIRAYNYLGMNYLKKNMPDEAVQAFTEANRLSNSAPITRAQLAGAYARLGRTAETHKILSDLLKPGAYPYVAPADIAAVYVWLGDADRAMEWLQKAYDERSFAMVYLKVHPGYDALRQDPRFLEMLRRLKFP